MLKTYLVQNLQTIESSAHSDGTFFIECLSDRGPFQYLLIELLETNFTWDGQRDTYLTECSLQFCLQWTGPY